mgnify:CR=1 FL=1
MAGSRYPRMTLGKMRIFVQKEAEEDSRLQSTRVYLHNAERRKKTHG